MIHFSSKTDEWGTPDDIFRRYDDQYHFTCDVCATEENAKCAKFWRKEQDGLQQQWTGRCWMNPPYGRQIGNWMKKAYESGQEGTLVVSLVPARTDTRWWHEWAMQGKIEFLRGRITFQGGKDRAPFPSAIVVFGPSHAHK